MTRYLLYIALLITPFGCKSLEKNKSIQAKSVEVFYDDDWTTQSMTHISKNGIIRFGICDTSNHFQKVEYYRDTLINSAIDSLNYYLQLIKKEKVDSIYDFQCNDCGLIIIRIDYMDTTIYTRITGYNKLYNNISNLARFILSVKPKIESPADSSFNFSLKKYFRLIPPGLF